MPLVRIEIQRGKSTEYKKTLLDSVHTALERALGIADWDRFQRLYELEPECFETSAGKTDQFMIITIDMFPGRSKEQKAAVFREITKELSERLGIVSTDVFIVLHEPANENWGLAGVQREG